MKHKKKNGKNKTDIVIKLLSYGTSLFLGIKATIHIFSFNKQNLGELVEKTLLIFFFIISVIAILILIIKGISLLKNKDY